MAGVYQQLQGIDDFYLKQKRKQTPGKDDRSRIKQPDKSNLDVSNDFLLLRAFDLDYKYGPAVGLTRAERWNRAEKLGLSPDPRIIQLIQQNPDNSDYSQCIWKGTLVAE